MVEWKQEESRIGNKCTKVNTETVSFINPHHNILGKTADKHKHKEYKKN